jgi:uncharacterized ParB-like nuclease family protein
VTTTPTIEPEEIYISQIKLSPIYQNRDPKAELDKAGSERRLKEHVRDLANDLKANGLRNPVTIFLIKGKYYLVGGHHRLEAAKKLEWSTIEAYVTRGTKEEAVIASYQENLIPDKPLSSKERTQNAWSALTSNETAHYRSIASSSGRDAGVVLGVSEAVIRQMRNALNELAKKALNRRGLFDVGEPIEKSYTKEELMKWWLTNSPLNYSPEDAFNQWWQARQLLETKGDRPKSYQRCVSEYERLLMDAIEEMQDDVRNDEACVQALKNVSNRIQHSPHR